MGDNREESGRRLAAVRDSAVERAVTTADPEAALVLAGVLETARLRGTHLGPVSLPILATLVAALGSEKTTPIQPGNVQPVGIETPDQAREPLLIGAAVAAREFDLTTADAATLAGCPPDLVRRYRTQLEATSAEQDRS